MDEFKEPEGWRDRPSFEDYLPDGDVQRERDVTSDELIRVRNELRKYSVPLSEVVRRDVE